MATFRKRSGKWQVLIRKKFAKPLTKTFVLKEDAEKYAREIESKIDQGSLTTYDEASKTTLRDLLERYRLEITAKKKGASVEDCKIKLLQRLPIAECHLLRVTPTKIAKLRDSLSETRKPGSVNKYLSFISNCWNIARKEWGIGLPENPVSLIYKPKVKDRRDRILTPEEYKRLLDACGQSKLYCMRGMVIFAYMTGARFGEILKLNKKDVDFVSRVATLRDTKNGEDRKIPLMLEAIKVLKEQPITTTGMYFQDISHDRFQHYWNRVRRDAQIENFRFHDLRACAISNFFLPPYNFNIPMVAKISGHKTWKELERYERNKVHTIVKQFEVIKK
jgi:integrase|tara:strand:+ start:94 stop:1095 length:1002 start_codon:yes stop_codon:yes gene_type:complete